MKAFAVLLTVLALLVAMPATAQIDQYPYVKNGLATLGMTEGNVVRIELFSYGPYVLSTSGKDYLPDGVLNAWYGDIDATTSDQVLLFQGTYDSVPFPDLRMNSSENLNLAEDRPMPGFQYAIASGKGRLSLLLPPIKGQRAALMYRVTVKETHAPEYVTRPELNETNIFVVDLAGRVAGLELAKYEPPTPKRPPFDQPHLFVGYGIQCAGPQNAHGVNVSLSLPMLEMIQFGALLNGAYEDQGGITSYLEWTVPLDDDFACLSIGTSLSVFRRLDRTISPRSVRYGSVYGAFKAMLPVSDSRVIELVFGIQPNAEVSMTANGGLAFTNWRFGLVCRAALTVF
jgi:hypothetical protein